MANFITGANKTGYHYIHVNQEDFKADYTADVRQIMEGDTCPICGGKIVFKKGIEIGNTFKLGTEYAQAMDLEYLDQENKLNPVWMGSYGIGIGRCMAALAEQHSDEHGLCWPINIAPYPVAIVVIAKKDEQQMAAAEQLYAQLQAAGVDVMLDDRDERPGVKFKDMDLIGTPIRLTVGKKIGDGLVEMKLRKAEKAEDISIDNVVAKVLELIHQGE